MKERRAEGWLHEERKEERKGRDSPSMGPPREQRVERTDGRVRGRERGRGSATAATAAAAAPAAEVYSARRVLGGSVCRVAWPIVCKGSRSSSKEPVEEEEEGSEAN